jgi:K+-transporting ATPase ATPase C chain
MRPNLRGASRRYGASIRAFLALTVACGIVYPLVMVAIAQLPGLKAKADGSLVKVNGQVVGSSLIGQSFTDAKGNPLPQYFQSRPSNAGAGYDPTASGASNLGPEQIIDTLANPAVKGSRSSRSLLSDVCARSLAVGAFNGVNGLRPYCTTTGVGAVLSVIREHGLTGPVRRVVSVNQECPTKLFIASYEGVPVECATYGVNYRIGQLVLIHGPGKAEDNPVPPDAVTTSASGLDPDISVAYANLQAPRVARARGFSLSEVKHLIAEHTTGRALGFLGQPAVNVLDLNIALDRLRP